MTDPRSDPSAAAGDDHLTAAADLLPQVWEELVVDTMRGVHHAVADRVFSLLPGTEVPKAAHDGISDFVYTSMTQVTRTTRGLVRRLLHRTQGGRDPELLSRSNAWRQTQAILNGMIGAELEEQDSPLAIRMALRLEGRDVPLDAERLARAFPAAGHRVGVFLHGLTHGDEAWDHRSEERGRTYDDVLVEHGVTPLRLRYNSGRHISHNGADLSTWLQTLHHVWPVPIHQIVLVGHSMGGLLIRSAAETARLRRHGWPASVEHVVMLGTPHDGAPLEQAANTGTWLLSQLPELRPYAEILRRRSAGIKDLRRGHLLDDDWHLQDHDALRTRKASPVTGIPGARHHNVAATLSRARRSLVGIGLGDVLVRWGSAVAHGQPWARQATVTHLGGTSHRSLLNHPEVELLLREIADADVRGRTGSIS